MWNRLHKGRKTERLEKSKERKLGAKGHQEGKLQKQ
jgi:hypothetical protein